MNVGGYKVITKGCNTACVPEVRGDENQGSRITCCSGDLCNYAVSLKKSKNFVLMQAIAFLFIYLTSFCFKSII